MLYGEVRCYKGRTQEEQRAHDRVRMRKYRACQWESMTPAQQEAFRELQKEYHRKWWKKMTPRTRYLKNQMYYARFKKKHPKGKLAIDRRYRATEAGRAYNRESCLRYYYRKKQKQNLIKHVQARGLLTTLNVPSSAYSNLLLLNCLPIIDVMTCE